MTDKSQRRNSVESSFTHFWRYDGTGSDIYNGFMSFGTNCTNPLRRSLCFTHDTEKGRKERRVVSRCRRAYREPLVRDSYRVEFSSSWRVKRHSWQPTHLLYACDFCCSMYMRVSMIHFCGFLWYILYFFWFIYLFVILTRNAAYLLLGFRFE